jgi:hypothetical protein
VLLHVNSISCFAPFSSIKFHSKPSKPFFVLFFLFQHTLHQLFDQVFYHWRMLLSSLQRLLNSYAASAPLSPPPKCQKASRSKIISMSLISRFSSSHSSTPISKIPTSHKLLLRWVAKMPLLRKCLIFSSSSSILTHLVISAAISLPVP